MKQTTLQTNEATQRNSETDYLIKTEKVKNSNRSKATHATQHYPDRLHLTPAQTET